MLRSLCEFHAKAPGLPLFPEQMSESHSVENGLPCLSLRCDPDHLCIQLQAFLARSERQAEKRGTLWFR